MKGPEDGAASQEPNDGQCNSCEVDLGGRANEKRRLARVMWRRLAKDAMNHAVCGTVPAGGAAPFGLLIGQFLVGV